MKPSADTWGHWVGDHDLYYPVTPPQPRIPWALPGYSEEWPEPGPQVLYPTTAPEILTDERDPIVYVDMDGVLVDFVAQICLIMGCPEKRDQVYSVGSWHDLHEGLGVPEEVMWQEIDKWGSEFWASAPWLVDGPVILQRAERMGQVYLCSTPARNPESAKGKLQWIERQLPKYARRYVLTKHKHHLAQTGRILIDDNPHNVRDFIQHGGQGYLVGHPYNRGSQLPTFGWPREVN